MKKEDFIPTMEALFSERSNEYFVNEYWTEECCDPSNWTYVPSTYAVPGVHIVTAPHMVAFADFNGGIENPGRDEIDYTDVDILEQCIVALKIVTEGSRMLYYNVDTMKKINGIKRSIVCNRLDIKGWMGVGVRFDNPVAEIEFAYYSNNPTQTDSRLVHKLPTKDDTIAFVSEKFKLSGNTNITEKEIRDVVNHSTKDNYTITPSNKGDIVKKVLLKLQSSGKTGERYIVYDDTEMRKELDSLVKLNNEWALEFWEDYDDDNPTNAVIIFINMYGNGISGSYQYIQRKLDLAQKLGLPANFVMAAKPPKRKNATIDSMRASIITGDIRRLEEICCGMFKLDVNVFSRVLPYNDPSAVHVFLRQDSTNEPEGTLIYANDIL